MKIFIRFSCALQFHQFRELLPNILRIVYQYKEDVMVKVWWHYTILQKSWNFLFIRVWSS